MNYGDRQLSDLALSIPMVTELFRKNRLDFCCGGKQTLKEACAKRNLNLESFCEKLEELEKIPTTVKEVSFEEMPQFIISRYHDDLRRRFPELIALAEKVERVHSGHKSAPQGLADFLKNLSQEMILHMMKEENILFPLIQSGRGSMALMPVKVMMAEHDSHGHQLEEIHRLTNDFIPPEDACTTWRSLYCGLEMLEKELMEHIHLENNVLFPWALTQGA